MQLTKATWATLAAVVVAACGSSSTFTVPEQPFGGSSGEIGPNEDPTGPNLGPTAAEPRCPSDAPKASSSCNVPGVVCNYGPDVRVDCNDTYECASSRWLHTTPSCMNDCPRSFDAIAAGTACPDNRVACSYEEGTCGCVGDGQPLADGGIDGGDGGTSYTPVPGVWKCVAPPTTVACPSARPRVLDACVKNVSCDYGSCELARSLRYACTSGFWQEDYLSPCDP